MRDVVWPTFWAGRTTSGHKNLKSRRSLQGGDTSASSCPNFTANWTWSRWFVLISFYWYWILTLYSTGVGANTGTESTTRRHLPMQRELHVNALTHALLMLSDASSINLGSLCQHTGRGLLGRWPNGLCTSRNLTSTLESRWWGQLMQLSNQIDPSRGTLNIDFLIQKSSKPKMHGKYSKRVFLNIFSPPDHDSGVYLL